MRVNHPNTTSVKFDDALVFIFSSRWKVNFLMDGVEFWCGLCSKRTLICRKCWHNQQYCSKACSAQSRRQSANQSQLRYSRTSGGRESQKKRDNIYRNKNTTTEHSPKVEQKQLQVSSVISVGCCSRCGCELEETIPLNCLVGRSLRRRPFAHTRGSG